MSDVETLEAILNKFAAPTSSGMEAWNRVKIVVEAVLAYVNADCSTPTTANSDPTHRDLECDGENHQEKCPAEMTRQGIFASYLQLKRDS